MRLSAKNIFLILFLLSLSALLSAQATEEMILSDLFQILNKNNYNLKIARNSINGDLLVTWINSDMIQNRISAILLSTESGTYVKRAFFATAKIPFYEVQEYDVTFHPLRNDYFLVWSVRKSNESSKLKLAVRCRAIDAEDGRKGRVEDVIDEDLYSCDYPVVVPELSGQGNYLIGYSQMPLNLEADNNQESLVLAVYDSSIRGIRESEVLFQQKIKRRAVFSNILLQEIINMGKGGYAVLGELFENNAASGARIFVLKTDSDLVLRKFFITRVRSLEAFYSSIAWNGQKMRLSFSHSVDGSVRSLLLDKNLKRLARMQSEKVDDWYSPTETVWFDRNKSGLIFLRDSSVWLRLLDKNNRMIRDRLIFNQAEGTHVFGIQAVVSSENLFIVTATLENNFETKVRLFSMKVEDILKP